MGRLRGFGAGSRFPKRRTDRTPRRAVRLSSVLGSSIIAENVRLVKGGLDKFDVFVYNGGMAELDWMTAQQIAEAAGVTDGAVRQALLSGRLKGQKLGGRWVIERKEAERWIALPHSRGRPPRQPRLMGVDDGS